MADTTLAILICGMITIAPANGDWLSILERAQSCSMVSVIGPLVSRRVPSCAGRGASPPVDGDENIVDGAVGCPDQREVSGGECSLGELGDERPPAQRDAPRPQRA